MFSTPNIIPADLIKAAQEIHDKKVADFESEIKTLIGEGKDDRYIASKVKGATLQVVEHIRKQVTEQKKKS